MEQTAVEWLEEQLNKWSDGRFYLPPHFFDQAKAMEKEQLCFFYVKGAEAELNNPYITNIEFYNKQFKNK